MKFSDYIDIILITLLALILFLPMSLILLITFPTPFMKSVKAAYYGIKKEIVK